MPMLFRYKCNSHSVLSHPIFFGERACCYFGNIVVILHIAPTASCSAEQSLIFWGKTENKPSKYHGAGSSQSSGTIMY